MTSAKVPARVKDDTKTAKAASVLKGFPKDRASLVPALREVQEETGFLPEHILEQVSNYIGLPLSQVYAVATYFDEFYLEPHGRNTVCVCRGSACSVKGGKDIMRSVEKTVGVSSGETTADLKYTVKTAACFGNCAIAPAMSVNKTLYGDLTPRKVDSILNQIK